MNILFYTKSFGVGGVEVVTMALAKALIGRGHQVSIFAFFEKDQVLKERLPKDIKLHIGYGYKNSKENVELIRKILIEQKIQIVVNQWGLPFLPIRVVNKARQGMDVKVISVYHSQVNTNGRIASVNLDIQRTQSAFRKSLLKLKLKCFRFITSTSMRYVYNHSDAYEVLSPSFVDLFKEFTGIKNPSKLVVQTNPVTVDNEPFSLADKKKEIIYVGRLESVVKRAYRVIDTWNYLEDCFPDWSLTIVGDGEDRDNLENHAKALGLKRVNFEGFQKPVPYYKRASLLMLTSEFEGFPLVLAESMSFGVVPFVYQSFSAVDDIIEDGKDGVILPKSDVGFDAEAMANKMAVVMNNQDKLCLMANAAIEKSKSFSLDTIVKQWEAEFVKIING